MTRTCVMGAGTGTGERRASVRPVDTVDTVGTVVS